LERQRENKYRSSIVLPLFKIEIPAPLKSIYKFYYSKGYYRPYFFRVAYFNSNHDIVYVGFFGTINQISISSNHFTGKPRQVSPGPLGVERGLEDLIFDFGEDRFIRASSIGKLSLSILSDSLRLHRYAKPAHEVHDSILCSSYTKLATQAPLLNECFTAARICRLANSGRIPHTPSFEDWSGTAAYSK
jgi:hypothetical protein